VERVLHLDVELAADRWLAGHALLGTGAVLVYRLCYAVLLGVLIWLFVSRSDVCRHARRAFVAMTGLALLVYPAIPMSPPRFALAGWSTSSPSTIRGAGRRSARRATTPPCRACTWRGPPGPGTARGSPCAARGSSGPSRRPWSRSCWGPGNYVLDVIGSALLLVTSAGVTRLWDRAHALRGTARTRCRREAQQGVDAGGVRH